MSRKTKQIRTPSDTEVREAGRQLQQGGLLGQGSSRLADKLCERSPDSRATAFRILSAAADYEPND